MKQQDWTEQLRQRLANHEEPVPDGLWADIERRVAPFKPARRVVLRRWIAAAAACGLVLAGLWSVLKDDSVPGSIPAGEESTAPAAIAQNRTSTAEQASIPVTEQLQASTAELASASTRPTRPTSPIIPATPTTEQAQAPATEQPQAPATEPASARSTRPISPITPTTTTSPSRPSPRRTIELSLHATNLLAYGGTTEVEPVEMASAYMGPASLMLARSNKVYLSDHDETTDHKMPLTVGLSLRLPLADRWWLASGVNYSRVASSFTHRTNTIVQVNHQRLHYVGVPLSLGYSFWQSPRLSAYASVGGEAQLNVKAQVDYGYLDRDRLQFSVLGSAGIEYCFLPQLSLYAQPGLRYYPDNASRVQNIFKERPLQFDLQLGLRFSLQ
ncbi:MAG: outer membrane beta-barrel protein [Prevotella sp.]|nr:outer membrane beta-barrel protein [Prevotella sp.]